jgi:hypothetical protein
VTYLGKWLSNHRRLQDDHATASRNKSINAMGMGKKSDGKATALDQWSIPTSRATGMAASVGKPSKGKAMA